MVIVFQVPKNTSSHPDNKFVRYPKGDASWYLISNPKETEMPGMDATAIAFNAFYIQEKSWASDKIISKLEAVFYRWTRRFTLAQFALSGAACPTRQMEQRMLWCISSTSPGRRLLMKIIRKTLIRIILQGYDARPRIRSLCQPLWQINYTFEWGIAAIASHERKAGANSGKNVTAEESEKKLERYKINWNNWNDEN